MLLPSNFFLVVSWSLLVNQIYSGGKFTSPPLPAKAPKSVKAAPNSGQIQFSTKGQNKLFQTKEAARWHEKNNKLELLR